MGKQKEGIVVTHLRGHSRFAGAARSWPIVLAVLLLAALTMQLLLAAGAEAANPNDPEYWEGQYPNALACYKHEATETNTQHGRITNDGNAVTLKPFRDAWPGDHYEVLIVKSGSVDSGHGPGNAVYYHPVAGVPYFGPLNSAGEQGAVSHWIICKGEDQVVTTTTTEPPETTTTTTPPETTTTIAATTTLATTTTQPPETTTTAPPETTTTSLAPTTTQATTTTQPEETTTTTQATTTTSQAPSSTEATTSTTQGSQVKSSETLPDTGAEIEDIAMAGFLILLFGLGIVSWARVAAIVGARKD